MPSGATWQAAHIPHWSFDAVRFYGMCPYAYFCKHVLGQGGDSQGANGLVREAFRLSELVDRHSWASRVVKGAVNGYFRSRSRDEQPMSCEDLLASAREAMRSQYRESLQKGAREVSGAFRLLEHEYSIDVPAQEWINLQELVDSLIRFFYSSSSLSVLRQLPGEAIILVDSDISLVERDRWGENEFRAHVDLAVRYGEQAWVILWKISRHELRPWPELISAAHIFSQAHGIDPRRIVTCDYLLDLGLSDSVSELRLEMLEQAADMREELIKFYSLSSFDRLDLDDVRAGFTCQRGDHCKRCSFQSLCLTKAGIRAIWDELIHADS
jgi:hypothetical protein